MWIYNSIKIDLIIQFNVILHNCIKTMSNTVSLKQLPKTLVPYLLDNKPILKINHVTFDEWDIIINAKIYYQNHSFSFNLFLLTTSSPIKYQKLCQKIERLINCIKNKIPIKERLDDRFKVGSRDYNDSIEFEENKITIGDQILSYKFCDVIISSLEHAILFSKCIKNKEYIKDILEIYKTYYPNSWLIGKSQDPEDDMEEILKLIQFYGYNKFTIQEYSELCKSNKYSGYIPIYYCDKTCPIKNNTGNIIVAIDLNRSYRSSISISYLFKKNENSNP